MVRGLQGRGALRRHLGAFDSLSRRALGGSSPLNTLTIEYFVGAIGTVVTVIVAVGVYSYYEIEKIAQSEKKHTNAK